MTEVKKQTELEELALLKAQEEDMVEALIRRYRPLVYATARRLCPSLAKDEDLLQCGMIGLWRAAEAWDGARPFSPLARTCIEHEMDRHLRALARQTRQPPLPPAQRQTDQPDWTLCELKSDLDRKFTPGSTEHTVLSLMLEGYTLADAAKAAGASSRHVRQRLRRKLGRLLGERDHRWSPT